MIFHTSDLFKPSIEELALISGIPAMFIEKDYWLTGVLKNLSESKQAEHFVFNGRNVFIKGLWHDRAFF